MSQSASGAAWSSEREGLPGLHSLRGGLVQRAGGSPRAALPPGQPGPASGRDSPGCTPVTAALLDDPAGGQVRRLGNQPLVAPWRVSQRLDAASALPTAGAAVPGSVARREAARELRTERPTALGRGSHVPGCPSRSPVCTRDPGPCLCCLHTSFHVFIARCVL